MELKPKYQYTYFIKPFIIKKENYENYLIKILNNKDFRLKTWEKEADLDIYSYFLPEIRDIIFFGFNKSKKEIEEIKKLSVEKQVKILKKNPNVHFRYILQKDTPGKVGIKNGMFFGIEQIELICFNTGVCFLIIKTHLDEPKDFTDILNFNYKFREISSNDIELKEYEKISIQTDAFNNREEFNKLIKDITGGANSAEDDKFYVYSYTCIDGESWNDKNTFDDIKIEFWKYSNILPSNYNVDVNIENETQDIANWKYAKFGFNKNACVLLSSSLNSYNFTKLPFEFENQYLYTYLITLYQKIYLKKLTMDLKTGKKLEKTRKNLNKFIKEMWIKEITKEDIGSKFYKQLMHTFDLENLYLETMNSYDVVYKEQKRRSYNISMKVMVTLLSASLVISIISLVSQL